MSDGNRVPTTRNIEGDTDGIPVFSLDELNRCRGQLLGGGGFGKVYAIEGFPGLAVKEIYLSGQPDRLKEITEFELEAVSRFSHPGFSSATRCLRTVTSIHHHGPLLWGS
ncbi:D-tyrosyl-tRNA(Tyr) deacylase [Giardia duodenalis]|uniref:D-tyrosyl-tRNA(Tyr) deacylase n=1 Tax=Giardia intestinalis TaxID=5741 RepID=V6TNJ3_GIAIN|nr:D-tyrosyl-tRNA(Tyr) deacylase [Giardia intestinalis]